MVINFAVLHSDDHLLVIVDAYGRFPDVEIVIDVFMKVFIPKIHYVLVLLVVLRKLRIDTVLCSTQVCNLHKVSLIARSYLAGHVPMLKWRDFENTKESHLHSSCRRQIMEARTLPLFTEQHCI